MVMFICNTPVLISIIMSHLNRYTVHARKETDQADPL